MHSFQFYSDLETCGTENRPKNHNSFIFNIILDSNLYLKYNYNDILIFQYILEDDLPWKNLAPASPGCCQNAHRQANMRKQNIKTWNIEVVTLCWPQATALNFEIRVCARNVLVSDRVDTIFCSIPSEHNQHFQHSDFIQASECYFHKTHQIQSHTTIKPPTFSRKRRQRQMVDPFKIWFELRNARVQPALVIVFSKM